MNIYVVLRAILHSLLSATNLLAVTAAAWSISASKGEPPPRASPGATLVIVGTVAFVVLSLMIWAECCIPHTLMSRVRTELALVPMLIVFQLIAAAVATSNAIQSVCHDPISCVALLVLAWVAPFCLVVYYLIVLAVTLDHAKTDPHIWDASPLEHPWFLRLPHSSPKSLSSLDISLPVALLPQPLMSGHRRPRSGWVPPPPTPLTPPLSPLSPLTPPVPAAQRASVHSGRASVCSLSVPKWARDLPPLRRGVEAPFPVRTRQPTNRWADPRRIDAPVSPSLCSEFP